jgi:hypothetical protein
MNPSGPYDNLIEQARASWSNIARISILRELTEGKSGAGVFVVDVDSTSPRTKPRGEHLLKAELSRADRLAEPNEASRHRMVVSQAPDFAKDHLPTLVDHYDHAGNVVLLYEIAGGRMSALVGGYQLPAAPLKNLVGPLSRSLLDKLNVNSKVRIDANAHGLLRDWLGYRLDSTKAPTLHDFIRTETSNACEFGYFGQLLVNPLWLCGATVVHNDRSNASFWGLIHGDLHPANILLQRDDVAAEKYWIIDLALSRHAPILYDHAYYELAVLLQQTGEPSPEPFLRMLQALDASDEDLKKVPLRVADSAWVDCLRSFRRAATDWQQANEAQRADAFDKQFLLARVAAGLNWCNKPITRSLRQLALASAAWAASKYMERYHASALKSMRAPGTVLPSAPADWNDVWRRLGAFDAGRANYVLVSGHVRGNAAAPLGLLPWSIVVDLDAKSNEGGLLEFAGARIKVLRSLMQFGKRPLDFDPVRGTGWLMCGGWETNFEQPPRDFDEWRRSYIGVVRDAIDRVKDSAGLRPVKVVILAPDRSDERTIQRVLLEVDERLRSPDDVVVIGTNLNVDSAQAHCVNADPDQFLEFLRSTVGASIDTTEYELPARGDVDSATKSRVIIPLDKLRNLEEDLEVLHSRITLEDSRQSLDNDAFWRGNPATWVDLQSRVDVVRDASKKLHDLVRPVLTVDDVTRRQATVEVLHTPGAGGTTLARRFAWDLHREFPVVVVRRSSPSISARIQELAQLTRLPILIITETDVLRAQDRERLYGDLLQNKVRCVVLSVTRSTQPESVGTSVVVQSPMSDGEAEQFRTVYKARTKEHARRQELDRITTNADFRNYRSPFFYGLITYEKNFVSIDKYVDSHLAGLTDDVKKVMCYLAIVTKYSQGVIEETLLQLLAGLKANTGDLKAKLGIGPWRLLTHRNRGFRLMHPLLADQVLKRQLGHLGGEARADELRRLTVEFLGDLANAAGGRSIDVEKLMEQMFINTTREGGGGRFSLLIDDLTPSGAQMVFNELVKQFPSNPHYLNHRARHRIYRLRESYELAEQDMDVAIGMAESDGLHHHTKGLVLRFWIERELRDYITKSATAEQLLEKIEPLEERATAAFERARGLRREDRFGYITHVQMILYIANTLLTASGLRPGESLDRVSGPVGDWLRRNVPLAEDLLADIAAIHDERRGSDLEHLLTVDLNQVYGNLNDLIYRWQKTVDEGRGTPDLRRALARCYFVRRQRLWSELPEKELRHIAELCRDNLSGSSVRDHDARSWFEAYRRLPEFDYLEAIDRMEAWAKSTSSIEPWYNLLMLHSVRLMQRLSENEEAILAAIEGMRRVRLALSTDRSFRFYSLVPTWFPIIDSRDLPRVKNIGSGQLERWNPRSRQRHPDLAIVNGVIDEIKGQQAGFVRLGSRVRAFFVPGIEFLDPANIGASITFHVGFSYEGLNAWAPERPAAALSPSATSRLVIPPPEVTPPVAPPVLPCLGVQGKLGRMASEQEEQQIFNFIQNEVLTAELRGASITKDELGNRLRSAFKGEAVHRRLGFGNLTDLLVAWSAFTVNDGRVTVARAST